ncbi:hypothetical protein CMO96_05160 [Candidatus Woesebacteria bacterium]|nr:hypothetical protein [Candidatus Woesebacteria bacterium]
MISIFAKEMFLNINPHEPLRLRVKPIPKNAGHAMRVSSMIRGDQIADQIGAKFNPEKGYENDVCIYVKPMVRKNEDFNFEGKPYLDIVDGHNLGQLLIKHPEVTVIVCSKIDFVTMSSVVPNKIVLIPQHHCNFERVKRTRQEIKTVGVIGTKGAFTLLPKGLREELAKRGMELLEFSRFFTRQDIIDFYLKIDVQVVWRPYKKLLSNPLKMVNAASFGIPTIALDEPAFKEVEGCYLPVNNLNEFLFELDKLKENLWIYSNYKSKCLEKSEEYHIEAISKLYKELDNG